MSKMDSLEKQLEIFQNVGNIAVRKFPLFGQASIQLLNYSENATYLVTNETNKEKYILRVCRPNYHTKEEIGNELFFMQSIAKDSKITVPKPIKGEKDEYIQEVEWNDFTYYCTAFTFLEGELPNEDNENELVEQFEGLGEVTALLHEHSIKNWNTFNELKRLTWDFDTVIGRNPKWARWQDGLGMTPERLELLQQVCDKIEARLKKFGKSNDRFGLIHGDLRLANLLVDSDQLKVIDFDDCGFGWYLFDLGTALSFIEHKPYVPKLVESWVKGYEKVRTLSKEEKDEIPTFILMRRLQLISWVGSRDNETSRALGAKYTEDTDEIAKKYLAYNP